MKLRSIGTMLAAVFAAASLTACGKPIDPGQIAEPDEMPPGKGLFTGETGEVVFKF